MDAEASLPVLQQCGITHILTVAEGIEPSHPTAFTYKAPPSQHILPPTCCECSMCPWRTICAHSCCPTLRAASTSLRTRERLMARFWSIARSSEPPKQLSHDWLRGQAGVSRSATVVVGFLMCRLGKTLEVDCAVVIQCAPLQLRGSRLQEALDHVKMVRPCAKPNVNFMQQLQMLEMVGHYPLQVNC